MVKSKNIIAGLGVVAGLGMALLPLGAFAAELGPLTNNQVIRAKVAEEFTLTVSSNKDIQKTNTEALAVDKTTMNSDLIHTVTVSGNLYGGYDLTLASASTDTNLKFVKDSSKTFGDSARYDANVNIPTLTTVAAGTSAWGYKVNTGMSEGENPTPTFGNTWTTIKSSASPDTIKTNANASNGRFDDTIYVNYGVSASDAQPAGMYEAEVQYKATAKI